MHAYTHTYKTFWWDVKISSFGWNVETRLANFQFACLNLPKAEITCACPMPNLKHHLEQ